MTDTPAGAHGSELDDPYGELLSAVAQSLVRVDAGEVAPRGESAPAAPDMPAVLARVIAHLAANVGGVDALLSGSPVASTQADLIRELVATATPRTGLLRLRTRPVRLTINVDTEASGIVRGEEFADAHRAVEAATSEAEAGNAQALATEMDRAREDDKANWTSAVAWSMRKFLTARGLPESVPVDVVDIRSPSEFELDALALEAYDMVDSSIKNGAGRDDALDPQADMSYTARARRALAKSDPRE